MADTSSRKRRARESDIVLVYLAISASFVTLISIFGPTRYLVEHHNENAMDVRVSLDKPQPMIIELDDLDHEELFQKTVKSCLPAENKKCKEYIPEPVDPVQTKVQRVALLAPPGDMSGSLLNRVEHIMRQHNKLSVKKDLDIEVFLSTHVPPYGYGKTHGLTKIIRLVPEPLLLEVTDALTAVLRPGESHTMITLADLKAALRMILRFHCRLSHLSAHTAIMSVTLMDLLSDPTLTVQKIRAFLAPNDEHKEKSKGEDDDNTLTVDDDQSGLMDAEIAFGSRILTNVQKNMKGENVADILDQVLLDEFNQSKNMTVWPCSSFWAAGGDEGDLSEITRRLAKALSPDCDDPFNTCFVERDKCEFKGDVVCETQKKNA